MRQDDTTEMALDGAAALNWHVWGLRRDDGRIEDHLVFGDSDELAEHAPAIAASETADIEHLGTFAEFAGKRQTIDLDLPSKVGAPAELSTAVGRGQFWDVVFGRDC